MKNLKLYGALFLALSAGVAFTACHDDDDATGSAPSGSNTAVGSSGQRVTRAGYFRYYYEKGKLESFSDDDGCDYYVTSYSPLTLVDDDAEEKYTFSFNGNGYIASAKYSYEWESRYYDESEKYSGSASFSYDSEGHLSKITESGSGTYTEDGEKWKYSDSNEITLTWSNGRLTKVVEKWTEKEDGETWKGTETYTFSYDEAERNPLKQPSAIFYEFLPEVLDALAFINYLGVGSSYFPTRMDYIEEEDGDRYTDYDYLSVYLNDDNTIYRENIGSWSTWYYSYEEATTRAADEEPTAMPEKKQKAHRAHSLFSKPRHLHKAE